MLLNRGEFEAQVSLRVAITGGLSPVLALDVVDHGTFHPCKQCRNHQANAFASAGWGKSQDMLGAVMAEVLKALCAIIVPTADVYALTSVEQTGRFHILGAGPPRGAVEVFRILKQAFSSPQVEDGENPNS